MHNQLFQPRQLARISLLVGMFMVCGGALQRSHGGIVDPGASLPVDIFRDRVHCLCIGINRYQHTDKITNIGGANDARALAALFKDRFGYLIEEPLLDSQATKAGILNRIGDLREKLGPEDSLIVYLGTHGISIDEPPTAANDNMPRSHGFIVPYDCPLSMNDKDLNKWKQYGLNMRDEIGKNLASLNVRHVVLFVDSCYSGFVGTRGSGADRRLDLKIMMGQKSRVAITAGTESQVAYTEQNSCFATELSKALPASEAMSMLEVFLNLRKGVQDASANLMQPQCRTLSIPVNNSTSKPGIEPNAAPVMNGEFVFIPKGIRIDALTGEITKANMRYHQTMGAVALDKNELLEAAAMFNYHYSANPVQYETIWKARLKTFQNSAATGDCNGMAAMFYACKSGLGMDKNDEVAHGWAEMAMATGEPIGKTLMGECYEYGLKVTKNPDMAKKLYLEAAEAGEPIASYQYGALLLREGQDRVALVNAQEYLKKSEAGGFRLASLLLTNRYWGGWGHPADHQEFIAELTKCAKQGTRKAMLMLYNYYSQGDPFLGVAPEPAKAKQYLLQAAEAGHPDALERLGLDQMANIQNGPDLFPINMKAAEKWLLAAAQQENETAHLRLAFLYEAGGVEGSSVDKVRHHLEEARRLGSVKATDIMGVWKYIGKLYPKNTEEAMTLLQDAAQKGDTEAMEAYATFSENRAIEKDRSNRHPIELADAMPWWTRLARQGHEKALRSLQNIWFDESMNQGGNAESPLEGLKIQALLSSFESEHPKDYMAYQFLMEPKKMLPELKIKARKGDNTAALLVGEYLFNHSTKGKSPYGNRQYGEGSAEALAWLAQAASSEKDAENMVRQFKNDLAMEHDIRAGAKNLHWPWSDPPSAVMVKLKTQYPQAAQILDQP